MLERAMKAAVSLHRQADLLKISECVALWQIQPETAAPGLSGSWRDAQLLGDIPSGQKEGGFSACTWFTICGVTHTKAQQLLGGEGCEDSFLCLGGPGQQAVHCGTCETLREYEGYRLCNTSASTCFVGGTVQHHTEKVVLYGSCTHTINHLIFLDD